jgi:RimJ/RimL family protein N-acetyltransferase
MEARGPSGGVLGDSSNVVPTIIVVDGVDVGTIWLENERREPLIAILGVLIGHVALFGRGIGQRSIRAVVAQALRMNQGMTIRLNVRMNNIRAIACYRKCGFVDLVTGAKMNEDGEIVDFLTMELRPRS